MDDPIIGYVRISDNLLMRPQGTIDTQFGPKRICFCLILQEICDFSGTWDLRYLIFLRMQFFPEFLVLSSILGFPAVNWAPKQTKTVNFVCVPLESKFKLLRDFSNSVCLIGRLTLVKISTRLNNIWESKAQKPPKRNHSMDAESIRKTLKIFNFTNSNAILMKITADMYLNKVFHLAKSWDVKRA